MFLPRAGDNNIFLGVELEIEFPWEENRSEFCEAVDDERVYFKRDGSLADSGVEVVSHPATYWYHVKKFPWPRILRLAREARGTSHDNGRCGLHIHISRRPLEEKHPLALDKLIVLIERIWPLVKRLSRRSDSNLKKWALNYGLTYIDRGRLDDIKNGEVGRYFALNLCPSSTVELRVFRGTLRYESFKAALQFADAIVQIATHYGVGFISRITPEGFIKILPERYGALRRYIEERKGRKACV